MLTFSVDLERGEAYASTVFLAPSQGAAMKHARKWGVINGWESGTRWTLWREFPRSVDEDGNALDSGMRSFVADGWVVR